MIRKRHVFGAIVQLTSNQIALTAEMEGQAIAYASRDRCKVISRKSGGILDKSIHRAKGPKRLGVHGSAPMAKREALDIDGLNELIGETIDAETMSEIENEDIDINELNSLIG